MTRKAASYRAGAVGMGIAIGPIVGGALLGHFWWGSVFLINVPIVIIGAILIRVRCRKPQSHPVGTTWSGSALGGLIYSIIKAGDLGTVRPAGHGGTVVAVRSPSPSSSGPAAQRSSND